MRKIFAVILILSMLMGMTITSMAAGGGTINITKTSAGVTYKFYKILEIENTNGAYFYRPTTAWKDFFTSAHGGATYGTVSGNGYIAWKDQSLFSSDQQTASRAAGNMAIQADLYVTNKGLTPEKTVVTTASSVEVTGLDENAYYLIESSVGGTVMAGPISSSNVLNIEEKNAVENAPTITKKVGNDRDYMSVDVGSTYTYTITVTFNEDVASNFTLTDTMRKRIYVDESTIRATKNGTELNGFTKTYDGTLDGSTENASYTLNFGSTSFSKDDVLVVTYDAMLVGVTTGGAVKYPQSHDNYGNTVVAQYGETHVQDSARVFTLSLNGYKYYTNDAGIKVAVENAGFKLKNSEGKYYHIDTTPTAITTKDGITFQKHAVTWVEDQGLATEIFSNASGIFSFYGIAAGNYTLIESTVPTGYVGAADREIILNTETEQINVENMKGAGMLPSTGGMGTTVLYLAGAALVLGAGVMMFARKKQADEE